jgi:hypothetical protein
MRDPVVYIYIKYVIVVTKYEVELNRIRYVWCSAG